jgi:cyclophilin family peptidyl-prolyl cis-trans isomerase
MENKKTNLEGLTIKQALIIGFYCIFNPKKVKRFEELCNLGMYNKFAYQEITKKKTKNGK